MEEVVIARKIKFNYYLFFSAVYLIMAAFFAWCGVYTAVAGEEGWVTALCWIAVAYILALLVLFLYIGIIIARSPQVLIVRRGDTIRCFAGKDGWLDISFAEISSAKMNIVRMGGGDSLRSGTLRILLSDGRTVKVRGVKNVSEVRDELLICKARADFPQQMQL